VSYTAYGRIYVNGIAVGTERSTNSTTAITYTENISLNAGDKLQIYCKISNAAGRDYVSLFRIFADILPDGFVY